MSATGPFPEIAEAAAPSAPGSDPPPTPRRRIWPWAVATLIACWIAAAILPFTFAGIDARFAAAWGEEILLFQDPNFDGAVPAKHPLTLAIGIGATPLGTGATLDLFVAVSMLSFVLLGFALWRLGRLLGGPLAGWAVTAIVLTRPEVIDQAISAGKDLPFAALVLLAISLILEHRVRRWREVLGLLLMAGLIRPEAWLLAALVAAWVVVAARSSGPPLTNRTRNGLIALALAAPVIWVALDLVLTGDPLHTLHQLRDKPDLRSIEEAAANAASREQDSEFVRVGNALNNGVPGVIGWPMVVAGILAGVAAWRSLGREQQPAEPGDQSRDAMLARAVAVSVAVIGILVVVILGRLVGLPIDDRFLLPIALLTVALFGTSVALQSESRLAQAALFIGLVGTLAGAPGAVGEIGNDWQRNRDLTARTDALLSLAADPAVAAAIGDCPDISLGGSPRSQVQIGRATLAIELDDDLEALELKRGRILVGPRQRQLDSGIPPLQSAFGFRVAGKGLDPVPRSLLITEAESGEWRFASLC